MENLPKSDRQSPPSGVSFSDQYDAFISYAREDVKLAVAVQTGIVELARAFPQTADRRIRIFRDATDLAPGGGLSDALKRVLISSRKFILIASPRAADSPWVRLELETFLESRSTGDVILALADGELKWDKQSGKYSDGPRTAFPEIGRIVFSEEPLYLDLSWTAKSAADELTVRNTTLRNSVSSLVSSITGFPREELAGLYVDWYRREQTQLRFNLGFRGAVGFALSVALAALIFLQGGISASEEYGPDSTRVAILATAIVLSGAGALVCGLRIRGFLAASTAFAVALPFFALGAIQTFDDSTMDKAGLSILSLLGFAGAGVLFSVLCQAVKWRRAAGIFVLGSVVGSAPYLIFPSLRYGQTDFYVFAMPWPAARLYAFSHKIPVALSEGIGWSIAIATLIGGLLGIEVMRLRLPALIERGPGRVRTFFRRQGLKIVFAVATAIAVAFFFLTSHRHRIAELAGSLNPSEIKEKVGSSVSRRDIVDRISFAVESKDALARLGYRNQADQFDRLLRDWLIAYFNQLDTDSWDDGLGQAEELDRLLRSHRQEVDPLLQKTLEEAASNPAQMGRIARLARNIGAAGIADTALTRASEAINETSTPHDVAIVSAALFESGKSDDSISLLHRVLSGVDLPEEPELGSLLWRTGVWDTLPDKTKQTWLYHGAAAVAMARDGHWDQALETLAYPEHLLGFYEASIMEVSKLAAENGKFDVAQKAAHLLRSDNSDWSRFAESERVIGQDALARRSNAAFEKAGSALDTLIREAGGRGGWYSYTDDLRYELWKLWMSAGRETQAASVLAAMTPSFQAAEALIDKATRQLDLGQPGANDSLEEAWTMLQVAGGRIDPQCDSLRRISADLVRSGMLLGAESIARECKPWRFEEYWFQRYRAIAKVLGAYAR